MATNLLYVDPLLASAVLPAESSGRGMVQVPELLVGIILAANQAVTTPEPAEEETVATAAPSSTSRVDMSSSAADDEEIVVTANRRFANIQDTPAVVTVVSGETLQDLNLFKLEEVSVLSPGLNLRRGAVGYDATAQLRGVPFDTVQGIDPAVDIYINDVPIYITAGLNSLFDVEQIEVLRGPQGTLRGRPSPAGAILVTTRRPDLHELGGYGSLTYSTNDALNVQGAVNVPIINDRFAIRVSGLIDNDEFNAVQSLNSSLEPYRHNRAIRATGLVQATGQLSLLFTYQRLESNSRAFSHVSGLGAGYNGPVLTSEQRLAVTDSPDLARLGFDFASMQLNWNLESIGAELIYIGSYQKLRTIATEERDFGNSVLNFSQVGLLDSRAKWWTHEVRLQSTGNNRIDYVFGLWSFEYDNLSLSDRQVVLNGAFGPPGSRIGPVSDPRYSFVAASRTIIEPTSKAAFASLTAHVTEQLDVTAGIRYNSVRERRSVELADINALSVAIPVPPSGTCPPGLMPSNYAGFCDAAVRAGFLNILDQKFSPWTYNAAISYDITPDFMVYASYSNSWRAGALNPGLQNQDNPVLAGVVFQSPETSDSFEIGFKSTWFDDRLRLNATIFQQEFDNEIIRVFSIPYVGDLGPRAPLAVLDLNANADTRIQGFEAEADFRVSPNWSLSLIGAYARGRIKNQLLPCRDGNLDGIPDAGTPTGLLDEANPIAFCRSRGAISNLPDWSITARSEVSWPIGDWEGYARGLFSYTPENPRADAGFTAEDYALLDLFIGARHPSGRWDIGLFAQNLLKTDVELRRSPGVIAGVAGLPPTGYTFTRRTPERQFGFSLRYRFGSE